MSFVKELEYACRGVDVHAATNMVTHEEEMNKGLASGSVNYPGYGT